jgi:DNA invertase Pin-like site-specific DNA recombinase
MAVALYARVSTAKQAEKELSIPDQLRQMRDWCKRRGFGVAAEYVEAGASATDDRRPVFQQMMAEATLEPSPFDAIIVHSRSRFFRDLYEFLRYERSLRGAGVRVLSITQETSDDPTGEMASKIFSLFDEYQSKENGKHTLRAMRENARQGFFNGSKPTFGYRTVETEAVGNKGRKKKRLAIDPAEAAVVARIFALYLAGLDGVEMGAKSIAAHLNSKNVTLRGQRWTRGRVHEVLANETYTGTYRFNRHDPRTGRRKPEADWVTVPVEAIVMADTFARATARRRSRAPAQVPPRVVTSPTLLTGLLKCGCCGAGMTLATGKGGRHRYYKCNTRIGQGRTLCTARSIPMERLDDTVLHALADRVFTPKRVRVMLSELRAKLKSGRHNEDEQLRVLKRELDDIKLALDRLYEAVEKGILPQDASLQDRVRKHQTRRQDILLEIGALRRRAELPIKTIGAQQVDAFARVLRGKLLGHKGFAKQYLRTLVSEIRAEGDQLRMTGSNAVLALAVAETKMHTPTRVPTSVPNWLPDQGSNLGPAD